MKYLLLPLVMILPVWTQAQDRQADFLTIMTMALKQDLIPSQLLTDADTLWRDRKFDNYIVIKNSKEYGLYLTSIQDGDSEIEIWDYERIFLHDVRYWVSIEHLTINQRKAKIEYVTRTYGKEGEPAKCFEGKITGKRRDQTWDEIEGDFRLSDCKLDFSFGHEKK
ncbi:MAG: hypothetical protein AB7K37_16895 [Cyclobacteriaceae bacterium]